MAQIYGHFRQKSSLISKVISENNFASFWKTYYC